MEDGERRVVIYAACSIKIKMFYCTCSIFICLLGVLLDLWDSLLKPESIPSLFYDYVACKVFHFVKSFDSVVSNSTEE